MIGYPEARVTRKALVGITLFDVPEGDWRSLRRGRCQRTVWPEQQGDHACSKSRTTDRENDFLLHGAGDLGEAQRPALAPVRCRAERPRYMIESLWPLLKVIPSALLAGGLLNFSADGFNVVGNIDGVIASQAGGLENRLDIGNNVLHLGRLDIRRIEHGVEILNQPRASFGGKRFFGERGGHVGGQFVRRGSGRFRGSLGHGNQIGGDLLLLRGRDWGIGFDRRQVRLQSGQAWRSNRRGRPRGGRLLGWLARRGDPLADIVLVAQFLGTFADDRLGAGREDWLGVE